MQDKENRRLIMERVGQEVDDLVRDLYSEKTDGVSMVQEAEITSRLCQRLEDRLDNTQAGDYVFRVIAQSLPDRGPNSMEKLIGADLFLSVSLQGADGFDKGIFIQSKYDRNIDRAELQDACRRMREVAGEKGSYVWIYEPGGVKVFSAQQINHMRHDTLANLRARSTKGFFGRILDCYAGSKTWGIPNLGERRKMVAERLRVVRASSILDINLKKSKA